MTRLSALHKSAKTNRGLYRFETPNAFLLESFAHPGNGTDLGEVTVKVKNFTSLCPITGQPDSGAIVVRYEPNRHMLESKSFKLYLMGFRQHGAFAETVAVMIKNDLVKRLKPRWLEVTTEFEYRGDIAFGATATYYEHHK